MTIGGLFLNNPRTWGWLILVSVFIFGIGIGMLIAYLFRRRLFARILISSEIEENERLSGVLKIQATENARILADNAFLRAKIKAVYLKISSGMSVIQSAFDGTELHDER